MSKMKLYVVTQNGAMRFRSQQFPRFAAAAEATREAADLSDGDLKNYDSGGTSNRTIHHRGVPRDPHNVDDTIGRTHRK
jgi:hypothetical protein